MVRAGKENVGAPPEVNTGATMEAKASAGGGGGSKKVGRWTIDQLRQTDLYIPLQNGTNKFDSQKGMTFFGRPRNNTTPIKAECIQALPEEIALMTHAEIRLQSGSNKYDSQKGMVNFGTGRDVCRESVGVHKDPADLTPLPEEKLLACEGMVRFQSGTNEYESQKGMTLIGTNRRETTKMKDTKHPEYLIDQHMDQSEIGIQMGTNKYASQKKMLSFGTNRRELTKMLDSKHPDKPCDQPDQSVLPLQTGTNKFASQKGMTGMGAFRWETLNPVSPGLDRQERVGQGMIPYQMGSNLYDSQAGMWVFGMPRDVKRTTEVDCELPPESTAISETIIRSQAGWNKGDSQKGYTSFGAPRDTKGKHIKRLWELEFPEEAEAPRL